MDVTRAAELRGKGASAQGIARMARRGEVARVRHGAYASEVGRDELARHRQLVAGTWPILGESAVLSHETAAALHGLPLWKGTLDRVCITRADGGHGRTVTHLRVRLAPLPEDHVIALEGFRVTSLERTALDLARALPYERAVAVLDAALHQRADLSRMLQILDLARGRSGVGTARAALAFADRRSESVGESLSRIRLCAGGLPAPELQVNVYDAEGEWVARCDFGWLAQGVLGEFDGKVKYDGTSEDAASVVMREKRHEERLRDLGWAMARWGWADLNPAHLHHRVEIAFSQARPEAIVGHAEPLSRF